MSHSRAGRIHASCLTCASGRASCGIYKESKEEDARDMYAQQNKAVHTSDY